MIYLPGSGILAAYTDAEGHLSPTFSGAVGIYLWAWFCLAVCFTVASVRSSWVLFVDFLFLDLFLLILACGHMLDNVALERAGYAIGYIVIFLSCAYPLFCWKLKDGQLTVFKAGPAWQAYVPAVSRRLKFPSFQCTRRTLCEHSSGQLEKFRFGGLAH